jgi:riboflavin synthase
MFTGIIQSIGEVRTLAQRGGDVELLIAAPALGLDSVSVGDSISVSGCCLTVTRLAPDAFAVDVSNETLSVTTLQHWREGAQVNLEKALCAGEPLGGHYVTGHVDGIARVVARTADARSIRIQLDSPAELAKYIARKGSVCVDGVSLTVNEIEGPRFAVNLIPHTLEITTLSQLQPGAQVNLEVDIIARYLERLGLGTQE